MVPEYGTRHGQNWGLLLLLLYRSSQLTGINLTTKKNHRVLSRSQDGAFPYTRFQTSLPDEVYGSYSSTAEDSRLLGCLAESCFLGRPDPRDEDTTIPSNDSNHSARRHGKISHNTLSSSQPWLEALLATHFPWILIVLSSHCSKQLHTIQDHTMLKKYREFIKSHDGCTAVHHECPKSLIFYIHQCDNSLLQQWINVFSRIK